MRRLLRASLQLEKVKLIYRKPSRFRVEDRLQRRFEKSMIVMMQ